jgi:hypothetical protein
MQINARLDLAIPLEDANTPKKFVTITIFAQLIHAPMDNVFSLQLSANNNTVKQFLAIQILENASMLM